MPDLKIVRFELHGVQIADFSFEPQDGPASWFQPLLWNLSIFSCFNIWLLEGLHLFLNKFWSHKTHYTYFIATECLSTRIVLCQKTVYK